jgi:hypothetical protein
VLHLPCNYIYILLLLNYILIFDVFRNNGATIPSMGLGCWQSKPKEVYNAVLVAIKAG